MTMTIVAAEVCVLGRHFHHLRTTADGGDVDKLRDCEVPRQQDPHQHAEFENEVGRGKPGRLSAQ
jgi:hypothetical protein